MLFVDGKNRNSTAPLIDLNPYSKSFTFLTTKSVTRIFENVVVDLIEKWLVLTLSSDHGQFIYSEKWQYWSFILAFRLSFLNNHNFVFHHGWVCGKLYTAEKVLHGKPFTPVFARKFDSPNVSKQLKGLFFTFIHFHTSS